MQTDFLTNAIEQLPFPKTADGAVGQFTLVSRDACLPFQGIQQINISGEQVSFCHTISIINHLDVLTKPTTMLVKFTISAVKLLT